MCSSSQWASVSGYTLSRCSIVLTPVPAGMFSWMVFIMSSFVPSCCHWGQYDIIIHLNDWSRAKYSQWGNWEIKRLPYKHKDLSAIPEDTQEHTHTHTGAHTQKKKKKKLVPNFSTREVETGRSGRFPRFSGQLALPNLGVAGSWETKFQI